MALLEFQNVTKSYHPKHKNTHPFFVLNGVSFTVEEKEFVLLLGKSGAGKTTVLKLIIGEEKPDSGKIFFEGKEITNSHGKEICEVRKKIGVVFQDYKLLPSKTVFENLAFVLNVLGEDEKKQKEEILKVLDLVGLLEKQHFYPEELSAGEKQKVAIARALVTKPKLILADEPTGNLDPYNTLDVIDLLRKINKMGLTVMLATHSREVVEKLKKRVLVLEGGKIVRDDEKGKFFL